MEPTVTINIDETCRECGKAGATPSGLCLDCIRKLIPRGPHLSTERHIKSVKIDRKSGRIEIVSVEKWGDDNERSWTLRCYEPPHPALPEALAGMEPHVRDLLDLPKDWARERIEVTKVTWSWSDKHGIKGASVSCHVHIDAADSPLILNTPHLPYEPYSDGGKCLPEDMVEALKELERCVAEYLDGVRSQGELFEEAA